MGKKRFFDDRLKYLSFIQNTSEKKAISLKLYPHIASMSQNKSYLRILDAGTGDGTIKSNVIKSFHKYHPYTSLLITGKEISYEDLKNTNLEVLNSNYPDFDIKGNESIKVRSWTNVLSLGFFDKDEIKRPNVQAP